MGSGWGTVYLAADAKEENKVWFLVQRGINTDFKRGDSCLCLSCFKLVKTGDRKIDLVFFQLKLYLMVQTLVDTGARTEASQLYQHFLR